ncbi:hypothetical protein [Burkholderia pyrrocinia]|uniref:hypothetical protein n=1 Tax=Burkholderia pyrrocinia TaxID=60550 RepID=UPI004057B6CE
MLFALLKLVGNGFENGCRVERPCVPGKNLHLNEYLANLFDRYAEVQGGAKLKTQLILAAAHGADYPERDEVPCLQIKAGSAIRVSVNVGSQFIDEIGKYRPNGLVGQPDAVWIEHLKQVAVLFDGAHRSPRSDMADPGIRRRQFTTLPSLQGSGNRVDDFALCTFHDHLVFDLHLKLHVWKIKEIRKKCSESMQFFSNRGVMLAGKQI